MRIGETPSSKKTTLIQGIYATVRFSSSYEVDSNVSHDKMISLTIYV